MYSQNNEDEFILSRFGNEPKTVLEIGANDGMTLSNSLLFVEKGWEAHLVEPNPLCYERLLDLHKNNPFVTCYNIGIAQETGEKDFYESGNLLGYGDHSLVSTLIEDELTRWKGTVKFKKTKAKFLSWQDFVGNNFEKDKPFHFISIDAEGCDWLILNQIDLSLHLCEILCIEWNGVQSNKDLFDNYCNNHGLIEIHKNPENIIYAKKT